MSIWRSSCLLLLILLLDVNVKTSFICAQAWICMDGVGRSDITVGQRANGSWCPIAATEEEAMDQRQRRSTDINARLLMKCHPGGAGCLWINPLQVHSPSFDYRPCTCVLGGPDVDEASIRPLMLLGVWCWLPENASRHGSPVSGGKGNWARLTDDPGCTRID